VTLATPEPRALRADAERNRARILRAAAEVFASDGLDATLHDVARHAGVGVGTVYRRFPDKQALIEAIFEDQLQQVVDLAHEASNESDSWAGLVHFMRGVCALQSRNRALNELMSGASYGQHKLSLTREKLMPLVRELMRRAQRDGSLRSDLATTDLSGVLLMLCTLAICTQDAEPNAWERYLDLILDGLRAGAQSTLHASNLTDDKLLEAMSNWYLKRR
jgi:AcrR family transcriptional regulator